MSRSEAWELALVYNDKAILERTPINKEYPMWAEVIDDDDND